MDKAIETETCAVGLTDLVVTQLNHSFLIGSIGMRVEVTLSLIRTKLVARIKASNNDFKYL